jgi:amino acid adenylation domain-containing protein
MTLLLDDQRDEKTTETVGTIQALRIHQTVRATQAVRTTVRDRGRFLGAGRLLSAADLWAHRMPAATAVSASDGVLTFRELATQSRSMAAALAAAGVGPGVSVGLCHGRSRLSVPGLLAVWRLGATAVPVDDRYPAEALSFLLRDSGTRVLLGDRIPAGVAPHRSRRVEPNAAEPHTVNPHTMGEDTATLVTPAPQDCAYIIYTSGTTGWPKGVEVTYEGLETFLTALSDLGLSPGGMGVNAVSPAFDGWLWCMSLYLMYGQGMAIIDLAAEHPGAADLADHIAAVSPRTVCLTPSLLSACVESVGTAEVLVVAGERLPAGLAERFTGEHRMLNVYGPTETTMAATWADTQRGDDVRTIGRPLPGYTVHVLDNAYRPVPAGESGELYIGGPAVARGYRNRPGLTAAHFVPDPFAGHGARMYRTGDLVRVRPDGQLEYLGRNDLQAKVRGFRVELSALEHLAATVAGVRAAAAFVVAAGDAVGLGVVLAPSTAGGAGHPNTASAECVARIRDLCARHLPDFMMPAVTVLPAIPVSATGKVDRAALARACAAATSPAGHPPHTERERQVCDAWSAVLPQPVSDIHADFFELGGHSLLAARAVAELRKSTGLRLSVRHLLAHPTAAHLAAELDRLAKQSADAAVGQP